MCGETFYGRHTAQRQLFWSLNNLKSDPLEIQHPKFENSKLCFIDKYKDKQWSGTDTIRSHILPQNQKGNN